MYCLQDNGLASSIHLHYNAVGYANLNAPAILQ